ncbi:NAD(P)/FAD-dependent oxidoreductase [Thalassobius sp. S69A]|uniref:NAD(P)/FAD-dependent oxidoreductase n=1 Tax=unclassified Thalassovita TaxID=2619711 RepID=UPI000C121400|nr:FAD-dependent oxidoreductase [Paracoccaceae bacterium]MBT27255.1 FAD-dependent oxidoreductase [Paracoccaceae bacterium]
MVDVTIYGAGIFGLSVAWSCLKKGATVRVIDPAGPGAGSSGGLVGALAPHVPENWNEKKQFQFESLMMAQSWWAEITAAGGKDSGYGRTGRLQPIADAHALALARARAGTAQTLWQGQAQWTVIPLDAAPHKTAHWTPHSPSGWLIHDTLTARMHPRMACAALAAAITAKGGHITPDADPEGRILWATGVQDLQEISAAHHRSFGNGVKGQAALLHLDIAHNVPQIFADAVHVVPHVDGTVAIGSTSERAFDDPHTTDAQLDQVIARAVAAVPALQQATIIERWAGVRPRSRSRAPVLGRHPLHPDAFIANGGFKIGFGMAPKVGEVMAELILTGRNHIPEGFAPTASL